MSNKKGKKQLLSSAPWRVKDDGGDSVKFSDAKLKVTNQPGQAPTMHVPRKKSNPAHQQEDESALDPELRYSFHRNYKIRKVQPMRRNRSAWGRKKKLAVSVELVQG